MAQNNLSTKDLTVKFRFPVEQTGTNEIKVKIPVAPGGQDLVHIDEGVAQELRLNDTEFADAHRAIMIVK